MLGSADFLLEVAERLSFSWAGRVPLLIYLILLKSRLSSLTSLNLISQIFN